METSDIFLYGDIMLVIRHENLAGKDELTALDFGDHFLHHLKKFQNEVYL